MNAAPTLFEKIYNAVASALPNELSDDVRRNVNATIRGACENLELVTREELEVQEAVLSRTREKVELLERQVAELEKSILDKPG